MVFTLDLRRLVTLVGFGTISRISDFAGLVQGGVASFFSERSHLMNISEELLALDWLSSFIVVYRDGTSERLLKGSGISVTSPMDEPDGFGAFSADIPKRHSQNQKQGSRHIRFVELDRILDDDGNVLYRAT